MNDNLIDVTGIDPVKLMKFAFAFSKPQGLGYLHYDEKHALSTAECLEMINQDKITQDKRLEVVCYMDYVKGRACKFRIWGKNNKIYLDKDWYDHTKEDLENVIELAKKV